MSNIEEDIKIIENYLNRSSYKEKDNNFFKGSGWEVVDLEIPQAMANILAERKQNKARIQKLEEENKRKDMFVEMAKEVIENSIPKQKVKDKIEEINKEYKDSKDENGESEYYYPDYTIRKLEELLEEK